MKGDEFIVDNNVLEITAMNPLVLAFIGDATYERKIRLSIIKRNPNDKIRDIHKKVVEFAKAKSQSKIIKALQERELLTEEEWYFVKRGRNTHSMAPKNADVTDYRYATGFETMIGYLELAGNKKRIDEIIEFALDIIGV